ncbi:hypothetical protein PINS_up015330 [Pythium insidiosum]|nr:hypothetical protein PINS_up015330 [Pythium insidiosum]
MNEKIGPCVETLLPVFLALMDKKAPCCGQLATYGEVLKLIQPTGKTTLQTLYDVVNGLHLSLCSTTGSASTPCAQPLLSFLADRVKTSGEASLLSALLFTAGVPLYALPDDSKSACAGLDSGKLPSRVTTTEGGGTTTYAALSCCATGYAALLESFDALLRQLTGNSMAETLNLITGQQDDKTRQFATPYATIKSCSFQETCAKPAYTLPSDSAKAVEGDSKAKTAKPSEILCKKVDRCDADKVCSSVCEPGSVKIAPWVARALSHQRNLSYDQPLCFTQLPGSHNSATTLAKGYGNRDQLMNRALDPTNAASFMRTNNQFVSLTDQLNMGARFIELDVHYFAKALHAGHCSRVDFAFLDDASKSIVRSAETLLAAGAKSDVSVLIEWQSSLFGCLPSLSGIRAEEQQPLADVLNEVATWVKAHPSDVVLLYADMGSEIEAFGKLDAVLELYKKAFGDLLFTPAALKTASSDGSWKSFKLNALAASGQRVVLLSTPGANDLMFDLRKLCDGFKDIPGSGATGDTRRDLGPEDERWHARARVPQRAALRDALGGRTGRRGAQRHRDRADGRRRQDAARVCERWRERARARRTRRRCDARHGLELGTARAKHGRHRGRDLGQGRALERRGGQELDQERCVRLDERPHDVEDRRAGHELPERLRVGSAQARCRERGADGGAGGGGRRIRDGAAQCGSLAVSSDPRGRRRRVRCGGRRWLGQQRRRHGRRLGLEQVACQRVVGGRRLAGAGGGRGRVRGVERSALLLVCVCDVNA